MYITVTPKDYVKNTLVIVAVIAFAIVCLIQGQTNQANALAAHHRAPAYAVAHTACSGGTDVTGYATQKGAVHEYARQARLADRAEHHQPNGRKYSAVNFLQNGKVVDTTNFTC